VARGNRFRAPLPYSRPTILSASGGRKSHLGGAGGAHRKCSARSYVLPLWQPLGASIMAVHSAWTLPLALLRGGSCSVGVTPPRYACTSLATPMTWIVINPIRTSNKKKGNSCYQLFYTPATLRGSLYN